MSNPGQITELIGVADSAAGAEQTVPPSVPGTTSSRGRGRPKGSGSGGASHKKKGAGPSKVANTPPKALAAGLAKACRWTTIPVIDWLELDASYVLWTAEAKAIAEPLSRLLWPYLRQMQLLQSALSKLDEASDGYALLVALYAYIERVGMAAVAAYFAKMSRERAERQAKQQTQQKAQEHGTSRQAGSVSPTGASLLAGLFGIGANGAGSNGAGSNGADGHQRAAAPARPAAAADAPGVGPDGIGERLNWNGGPFGATDFFSGIPVSYVEPEAWNLAGS